MLASLSEQNAAVPPEMPVQISSLLHIPIEI
jgi:hypothetical protein